MLAVDHEHEKQALEQVLSSGIFERSPSLAQVLTYICGKYFDGTADDIKEYSIAIDALGRATDFDQKRDSIVRVQVHRLRERLAEYYGTAGASSEIHIEIPQGQYIPRFVPNPAAGIADPEPHPKADVPVPAPLLPPPPKEPSAGRSFWPRIGAILIISAAIAGFWWTVGSGRGTVTVSGKSSSKATIPAVIPGDSVRILVGLENGTFTDQLGHVWQGDRYFTGGTVVKTPDHMIQGTREPRLYQARRQGIFSYDIPLNPGAYELRLHFAETNFGDLAGFGGEGSRAFAIGINGKTVLPRLDVTGEAGVSTAHIRAFRDVEPAPDGMLHLSFQPIVSVPFINAIEITPGIRARIVPIRLIAQDRAYRDSQGREWEPDRVAIGGQLAKRAPLASAEDHQLYAGERFGNLRYIIPVPPGKYSATFYMAERWLGPDHPGGGGPGSRLFDILCNGVALVRDLDVLKRAGGPDKVLLQTFHGLEPNHQGQLDLWLVPNKNFPMLSALEVLEETR